MQRHSLLSWGTTQLSAVTETAYLDAATLLSFTLNCSHTDLLSHPEWIVSEQQASTFRSLIKRRSSGEPIAYLKGACEFWSLPLKVSPACLIPRAETELLVENILAFYPSNKTIRLVDLGTGTGAIAIALSLERPLWDIVATDLSNNTLSVAKENANRLSAQIEFRQGDWFKALSPTEHFDAVISNPPYLAAQDPHLKNSIRYEPRQALVGGEKGDEILEHLIQNAPYYLLPKGRIWLEQGFDQGQQIKNYLKKYGYHDVQQYYDLSGIHRMTSGIRPK